MTSDIRQRITLESYQPLFNEVLREVIEERQLGEQYYWDDWWPPTDVSPTLVVDFFGASLMRAPAGRKVSLRRVEIPKREFMEKARQSIKQQIIYILDETL